MNKRRNSNLPAGERAEIKVTERCWLTDAGRFVYRHPTYGGCDAHLSVELSHEIVETVLEGGNMSRWQDGYFIFITRDVFRIGCVMVGYSFMKEFRERLEKVWEVVR